MPIYEYECQACNHYLDVLQKLSDDPLTYCPECGKAELRKLVSAPSFRLKGGGWYETDFKKDNQRNLADGGKDKADGSTAKSTDASDGKASGGSGKAEGAATGSGTAKSSGSSGGTNSNDST